ncbi:hypothetical protein [Streptomyces boluensis]|uniref:Uncharacterized protein n=1 Tax=Streptomyces boluensis TaxID=1775135 RepID=A0A964UWI7_9ACTN|nr:hypothetical protein [Streptomyces boluensis]NBE56711.1 hypothetical protein [Streptomyces boluensis]
MFDQISFPQQIGLSVLAVAGAVWAVGLVRMLRRDRSEVTVWRGAQSLYAMPRQRSHPADTVELSAAERDAFIGLVRQLTDGRP